MKKYIVALAIFAIPLVSFASIDQDLRYGSSGPEVTELQEYLNANGFLTTQPTGNFYSLTRKAVVAYQTSVNLPATGFVGPLTRGLINADLVGNTSPEEEQAAPVVTVSKDTSALQKQLNDLLLQVQALIAQQKTANDAQVAATNAQTQVIQQVAQNTTPSFGSPTQSTSTLPVAVSVFLPINPSYGYGGNCLGGITVQYNINYSDGTKKELTKQFNSLETTATTTVSVGIDDIQATTTLVFRPYIIPEYNYPNRLRLDENGRYVLVSSSEFYDPVTNICSNK